jgi:phospholipid-binding lipoprotein MlaA
MKSFLVPLLLSLCQLLASAADPDPNAAPPPMGRAAPPAGEGEFQDPFATPEKAQPKGSDPLEKMNRAFFKFNDRLYFWVLKPTATGYNKVAPQPFRESIKHFFVNAQFPVRFVNNVLQGKLKGAGIETTRFLVNSTLGIGGLFDPARDEWKIQPHPEDLDQTLGVYGLGPGIYFDWPLLGPSSVRGTAGMIGDGFLSPWDYLDGFALFYGMRVSDTVNSTSLRLGDYERFKEGALDPYVALRDAFYENRRSLIQR